MVYLKSIDKSEIQAPSMKYFCSGFHYFRFESIKYKSNKVQCIYNIANITRKKQFC